MHSPGPWFVRRHADNPFIVDSDYREAMQEAYYIGGPRHSGDFLADVFLAGRSKFHEQDVLLMAAAPNLLRACLAVVDGDADSVDQCRAAIKKATQSSVADVS